MIIKVQFHHEDSGLCQTTFKEVDGKRYFNRTDYGMWYTVYPHMGYWENSSLIRDDIIFQIVDKSGNILFTESNADEYKPLKSIYQMAKAKAKEVCEKLGLRSNVEWRAFVIKDLAAYQYKDYAENWLYWETECKKTKTIEHFSYLGLRFEVVEGQYIHKISGKRWKSFWIENMESDTCETICGYVFRTGRTDWTKAGLGTT